jgi:hypothetical protein
MTPQHPDYDKCINYLLEYMRKQEREEQLKKKASEKGKQRKDEEYKSNYGTTWQPLKHKENTNTYSPKKYKRW